MAYNLSASISASLSHETHLFVPFISPQACLNSGHRKGTLKFHSPKQVFLIAQVSLQEWIATIDSRDSDSPDEKAISSSNSYVWVNPKSPRASKLRKKSHDFRCASLVKVSESLDSCGSAEENILNVLATLGDTIIERDAVIVLNNMSNTEIASLVLNYFQEIFKISGRLVLYNVALKILRNCKDLNGAEKLFGHMLERGIKPDNVTFSTIISCVRNCNLPDKAVQWFEKMPSFGCEPNDVTYSVMIDTYGIAGNMDIALSLYDRARSEKWRLDAITFSTLIRIYGSSGNFDGCLNLFEEIKALRVKPNATVYNTLLDAMGRAKRPW